MSRKYVLSFDATKFHDTGVAEITDDKTGEIISMEEAKAIVGSGAVVDASMSFMRLVQFDFDLGSLKEYYCEH